jgi:hypothetical protein
VIGPTEAEIWSIKGLRKKLRYQGYQGYHAPHASKVPHAKAKTKVKAVTNGTNSLLFVLPFLVATHASEASEALEVKFKFNICSYLYHWRELKSLGGKLFSLLLHNYSYTNVTNVAKGYNDQVNAINFKGCPFVLPFVHSSEKFVVLFIISKTANFCPFMFHLSEHFGHAFGLSKKTWFMKCHLYCQRFYGYFDPMFFPAKQVLWIFAKRV